MAEIISKQKFNEIMVHGKNERLKQKLARDMRDKKVAVHREKPKR